MPDNPKFTRLDECEDKAYALIFGEGRQLFDLAQETDAMRDRYGRNTFGQSCLMARRLVARGVPYVTINYKGWDTHKQHFEIMRGKLPEMDQAMAALFQDLSEQGLLDSTIVWWGGEFGRSPKVQWDAPWNGGRSHYGKCFCHVVAGGTVKLTAYALRKDGFTSGIDITLSDPSHGFVLRDAEIPEDKDQATITPALQAAGWDLQAQISEELTFTAGRIMVQGKKIKRGKARRAD